MCRWSSASFRCRRVFEVARRGRAWLGQAAVPYIKAAVITSDDSATNGRFIMLVPPPPRRDSRLHSRKPAAHHLAGLSARYIGGRRGKLRLSAYLRSWERE